MPALKDLTGRKFGRLTVEKRTKDKVRGRPRWTCACGCGSRLEVDSSSLLSGNTKSCGCMAFGESNPNYRHGMGRTPTYEIWQSMWGRCSNPRNKGFPQYGGRGITVDPAWRDYSVFIRDMGEKPAGRWSLDRIDNNKGYSRANCRWATDLQQARNKSNNTRYMFAGEELTWSEWAERGAVSQQLLRSRVVVWGWDFATALNTPPWGRKSGRKQIAGDRFSG